MPVGADLPLTSPHCPFLQPLEGERPMFIDPLEPRRFLTVVSATLTDGVLRLVGNDKRDIIEVTPNGSGGVTASYDGKAVDYAGPIRLISINTGGGGDLVSLATIVEIPAFVDAGAGPDFINGGAADDTILAGGGSDAVVAGRGNDSIDGGLQGDLLVAGAGDDTIVAGSSDQNDDTITGGNGQDV